MPTYAEIRLQHLMAQAEEWYSTLSDYVFRHTTIQVVVLGWALTSSQARDRINDLGFGGFLIALLPIAYSALVLIIFRRISERSNLVMEAIAEIDSEARADVSTHEIEPRYWLGMALVHLLLSILIAILLLSR